MQTSQESTPIATQFVQWGGVPRLTVHVLMRLQRQRLLPQHLLGIAGRQQHMRVNRAWTRGVTTIAQDIARLLIAFVTVQQRLHPQSRL
jgi:hypothetical protein